MSLARYAAKRFLGKLICGLFKPLDTRSSITWARDNINLGLDTTTIEPGRFDALVFPALEYVYKCLDNPFIPVIYCIKSARFGWTTATLVWLTHTIVEWPRNVLFCFGTKDAAQKFYKDQFESFIAGIPAYLKSINIGKALSKVSWNHTTFYGGVLRFISTRVMTNVKSTNAPIIIMEEPDNNPNDVNQEGDLISNLFQRMKNVPIVLRKFIVGGTPTIEGLSRIAKLMSYSNDMVFRAVCHHCSGFVDMDHTFFNYFTWGMFPDGFEHKQYGKYDPNTVIWLCPHCEQEWSFEQKAKNILEGKKYGFIDHTGEFSCGWHPLQPDITEIFGFRGSECLSHLPQSNFIEMSKTILAAKFALSKGDESLMTSVMNNMYGCTYRVSKTSVSKELLEKYYSNFLPKVAPYEAIMPYLGIDVQRNRLAFTICCAGKDSNVYVVDWFEEFGEPCSFDSSLWLDATAIVRKGIQHISGINLNFQGIIIDCQDGITSEYVYRWVAQLRTLGYPVFAVRGVNNLRLSSDPIFSLPSSTMNFGQKAQIKTLADTYGIIPYQMGTHACQSKVMLWLENTTKKELSGEMKISECLYFTRYERDDFLDQMTPCVLVPQKIQGQSMYKWELPSGKRMEALACVKMCFWAMTKDGIFNYRDVEWEKLSKAILS